MLEYVSDIHDTHILEVPSTKNIELQPSTIPPEMLPYIGESEQFQIEFYRISIVKIKTINQNELDFFIHVF